jgi:hypothetical protein
MKKAVFKARKKNLKRLYELSKISLEKLVKELKFSRD